MFLNFHQRHNILLGDLSCRKLGNITFNQLACLQQFKRPCARKLNIAIRLNQRFWLIADDMDARTFTHLNIALNLQHDDSLANHGAAHVHLFGDITLGWQFLTHRVNA